MSTTPSIAPSIGDLERRLTDQQLRDLADDAFDVLNWARRLGFNRERQVAELVRTFEVRLGYRKPVPPADGDQP